MYSSIENMTGLKVKLGFKSLSHFIYNSLPFHNPQYHIIAPLNIVPTYIIRFTLLTYVIGTTTFTKNHRLTYGLSSNFL